MRKQVIVKEDFTPLRLPGGDGVMVAQCIRAGNFVFLSGQTAFNEKGELVGVGDARVQAEQACENIKRLMELAGGTLSDVVKVVIYVTGRAHRAAAYPVIRRYFPEVWPCGTGYVVPGLARPELLVEIDAWGFVDDDKVQKKLLRAHDVSRLGMSGTTGRAAQAYQAGNLVFLQGQVGWTLDSEWRGRGQPAVQAKQAMENIQSLMGLAGGSLADIVRVVTTVTEREDRSTSYPVIKDHWPGLPPPGTGLIVDGLATEDLKIEVDAWGFVDTPEVQKKLIRSHDLDAAGMLGSSGRAAQCVRAGNLVFLQGQVGWTLEGRLVAIGDARGQARQAMENIRALMKLAGGSLADIVRVVVYVTDRAVRDLAYPVIKEFWGELWPCGTGVVVKGLARPEMLLEIDAYGFIDDRS
jgi:enamine deaminase RidA (YjgF/YER057c/UK114 family)